MKCQFTLAQFWSNTLVRAVVTALAVGGVFSLTPLIPVLSAGIVPAKDTLIAAAMMGAGGFASAIVSLLSRFTGDPNSGSFTH